MEFLACARIEDSSGASQSPSKGTTQEGDAVSKSDEYTLRHAKEVEVIVPLI